MLAGPPWCSDVALILTESQMLCGHPPQGVLHVTAAALAAQVEPLLMIDFLADRVVIVVVEPFQQILNLLQMISVVFEFVVAGIQCGVNFHADDVPHLPC